MKLKLFIFSIISSCMFAASAAPIEHTIERGETLESIARKYNVSGNAILEANPGLKDMFFAGVVIRIPESNSVAGNSAETPSEYIQNSIPEGTDYYVSQNGNGASKENNSITDSSTNRYSGVSSTEEDDELDFSCLTASYMATFKDFEHGMYGLDFMAMLSTNTHFGFIVSLKANYGLAPKDYAGMNVLFGGVAGLPLNKYIMPNIKVRGFVTYDNVSSGYDRNNNPTYTSKVGGGMYFTPSLNFKVNKFTIAVGYNLGFKCGKSPDKGSLEYENGTSKYIRYESKTEFDHNLELSVGITI